MSDHRRPCWIRRRTPIDLPKSGKRLDMGKSCVWFRKIEDVPLDVVGKTVKRITAKKFIAAYEAKESTDGAEGANVPDITPGER